MKLSKVLIYILIFALEGCAGCSKSGRESLRNKKPKHYATEKSREEASGQKLSENDSEKIISDTAGPPDGESLSELYAEKRKGVFMVFSTNDGNTGVQGSGFFMSSNGLAVSNEHVFRNYKDHYIKLYDGTVLAVDEVIKASKDLDYVIFQVNIEGHQVYSLAGADYLPTIGEEVFTIGNPKGLEQTLSKGIISGYRESNMYIQTTAEITNGSSGGPLFNMAGEVIGITTAGYGEANLNFAINLQLLEIVTFLE